ncbi:LuxR C-terminal-related transcriptional regulator [Microvirga yunnanensis]|uniref:LuxR C-terminal-related transcriptional regulator n=1 Tax=Microvirga yunnanensis TaxID=2953740 RepID=UPI0021C95083|nr:LuxR C-terminal-related transcriptional regulator [Microvirga sp. HBU65207]
MAQKAAEREGRRPPVSFRTTEAMRDRLERAASAAGRSITQEIEHRLEQSFHEEDLLSRYFGSDDAIELLKEIALIINHQMARSGRSWRNDKATREAIREYIFGLFFDLDDEEGYARKKAIYEQYFERKKSAWRGTVPSTGSAGISSILDSVARKSFMDKLSSLESQILGRLMTGVTNKQIARELGITEANLKVHVEAILNKITLTNLDLAVNAKRQHSEPALNDHEQE